MLLAQTQPSLEEIFRMYCLGAKTRARVLIVIHFFRNSQLSTQMNVFNQDFAQANAGVTWTLQSIDRSVNATWYYNNYGSQAQFDMKRALRKGGPGDLNVYSVGFVSFLLFQEIILNGRSSDHLGVLDSPTGNIASATLLSPGPTMTTPKMTVLSLLQGAFLAATYPPSTEAK